MRLGTSLCVAILIHNVLEGFVVALPIWFATGSQNRVILLTLINGMMEPLGVLLSWVLGAWNIIQCPESVNRILCCVAGIMGAISFGELLPSSVEWLSKGFNSPEGAQITRRKSIYIRVFLWTLLGIIGGFIVLAVSDWIVESFHI